MRITESPKPITQSTQANYLTIFYIICFILALTCFYFSISENLFFWFFGDELGAAAIYKNLGGFWGCTKYYYSNTSVNRLTAILGTCTAAQISSVFNMPLMGWVLGRLIYFFLVPVSMAYLLKEIIKIPFKLGLCISLFLSAIVYLAMVNSGQSPYMYIICLAIYSASTITFFTLVAIFTKSITNNKHFVFFCLVFAMNLNAHEVFLVISGFFIPLFAWYRYKEQYSIKQNSLSFVKHTLRCRAIWVLLLIYLCSSLADILAPGVKIRQGIWPSSGTIQDGIGYAIISVVNTVNIITNLYILTLVTLFLGIIAGISNINKKISNYYLLYSLIFCAPFIYILITGFLLGITPSLFSPSTIPSNELVQFTRNLLGNFVTNKTILLQGSGGLAARQQLFPCTSLLLNLFMAGFFLSRWISGYLTSLTNYKIWPIKITLISSLSMFLLLNPYGVNSLRILHAFFNPGTIKLTDYAIESSIIEHPQISIFDFFMLDRTANLYTSKIFNTAPFLGLNAKDHESNIINIGINNYLKEHRGSAIDTTTFQLVYKLIDYGVNLPSWTNQIYNMYKVYPNEKCLWPTARLDDSISACRETFGGTALNNLMTRSKLTKSQLIDFNYNHKMRTKIEENNHICLIDEPAKNKAEHFVANNNIQLLKGFNYLIFEAKPTNTQLYIYIVNKNTSLSLKWSDKSGMSGTWSNVLNKEITPVFSQLESTKEVEKLTMVVYCDKDQQVQIRWQHGYKQSTIYKGKEQNTSTIYKAEIGQIVSTITY